ncbi:MAG TPA: LysR family transcriptional regulator [Desulfobacteraceae bacterium]|nr:LysR family transcriptional regulator [Deltaproteobacteria bacterium]MCD6265709.1 LysR family transcriptional regulator [Deltaproteobacteria bacterium]HDH87920.1 LysR family transcriptional regulator [Desulfobacteraceae bacterium]
MLNPYQLRAFYEAAKSMNFTIAAKNLFVSQPAVTTQIKLFEEYCNLRLFKRKGRRMDLTSEGESLFYYAEKVFQLEKKIEKVIKEFHGLKRGYVRLGTTKTSVRYSIDSIMLSFHKSFPDIKIKVQEGTSMEMLQSLLDFRNDLALVAHTEDNPNIDFITLGKEEIFLIAAPGHYLANKNNISFNELDGVPVIIKEIGSGTRKVVDNYFARSGVKPKILIETNKIELIIELVKQGEGISFLARRVIEKEIAGGTLIAIPIKPEKLFLNVGIAYLNDEQLSPAAKALLDFLFPLTQIQR